jgi:hypothetical protein
MGIKLDFSGTLNCGPADVSDDESPGGSSNIPYQTSPAPKWLGSATGDMRMTVASGGSFVPLPGVGPGGPVLQGAFLYLWTDGPMLVRTTTYNESGNVQAVEPVSGLKVVEFDPDHYLALLEVQGVGEVEYFVGGPAGTVVGPS